MEEEPTSEEEIDTWDWVPDSLIVEACRLDNVPQLWYMGSPNLACHVFGLNLD
jgi:hypothetical protein